MNPTQKIWLIRHGETAWSRTGQHTGRTDIPLLPEAEPRLKALRPELPATFSLVLCSPLQRARQTAEILGFNTCQFDGNLVEWNYGDYDGKTLKEIQKNVPTWSIWKGPTPNGETLDDVAGRARNVIDTAQAAPGDVALISHGHFLRVLAACWLELPPVNAEHFALSPGSLSILGWENEAPVLMRWNWLPSISCLFE